MNKYLVSLVFILFFEHCRSDGNCNNEFENIDNFKNVTTVQPYRQYDIENEYDDLQAQRYNFAKINSDAIFNSFIKSGQIVYSLTIFCFTAPLVYLYVPLVWRLFDNSIYESRA